MNKAFVISLDSRREQFKEVQRSFKPYGISCERVSAVAHTKGSVGCALSHLKIIADAKKNDWPWVIVLEDDCVAREGMKDWSFISKFLIQEKAEWDLFLGGCIGASPKKIKKIPSTIIDIIECFHAYALHFVIYNKNSYDRILAWHELPELLEERKDIDIFIQECSLKIWVTVPFIAWQEPGYSSILKRSVSYDHLLAGTEQHLTCFKVSTALSSNKTEYSPSLLAL